MEIGIRWKISSWCQMLIYVCVGWEMIFYKIPKIWLKLLWIDQEPILREQNRGKDKIVE